MSLLFLVVNLTFDLGGCIVLSRMVSLISAVKAFFSAFIIFFSVRVECVCDLIGLVKLLDGLSVQEVVSWREPVEPISTISVRVLDLCEVLRQVLLCATHDAKCYVLLKKSLKTSMASSDVLLSNLSSLLTMSKISDETMKTVP